jgi:TolB-like protein
MRSVHALLCGTKSNNWAIISLMSASPKASDKRAKNDFLVGGWLVRPPLNEISTAGVTRRLRSQLMDFLVLLAERAGEVISKDEILEEVWQGRFVTESVLPRCVAELRELLGDEVECSTFIETIPKRGYRLIAPVVDRTDLPAKTRQPSVLVLPFRDLSEKKDQQFFCDGLCEQIINSLTGVAGLRVIARSSAFLLDKVSSDLSRLGTHIHVDKILEGSVRKAQHRIRITLELTDTATQSYVWSESYEGRISSIFELQDRITQAVITQMKVELLDREKDRVARRPTNNLEAHTCYLKGLYHWNQRTREGFILSRQCFEAAIQNDPGYTLPYVALANSYSIAAFYGFARPDKCFPEAKRLVGRADAPVPSRLRPAHCFCLCLHRRAGPGKCTALDFGGLQAS